MGRAAKADEASAPPRSMMSVMSAARVGLVATTIHGRVLVRDAANPVGILAGCHGYMENAAIQMDRLTAIPGAEAWTRVSIQALHRFYKGRSEDVVASWMTREDREAMIADNLQYVDAVIASVAPPGNCPVVWAGFSQGVAMAFRAAACGQFRACGVIAVGGDVPPELIADSATRFPPALLVRGARDEWLTQSRFDADAAALRSRGVAVETLVVDGAHEWTAEVSAAAGEFLHTLPRGPS